jgi:hypothetical protein
METAPNARGTPVVHRAPYHLSPNTLLRAFREKSLMNNLKGLNPVPNSIQTSSEDPPGFIYPSYRAAQTETHRDKPPLKGSHQPSAYVSSAVGDLYPYSPSRTPLSRTGAVLLSIAVEAPEIR